MAKALFTRLEALEQIRDPQRKKLSAIVIWPTDGTEAEQADAQNEIDYLLSLGMAVDVTRNQAELDALVEQFI